MARLTALVLKTLTLALKNQTFTIKHGPAKGMKRRYGPGFKPNQSLSKEEQYLMELDLKGKTIYDIGSYVGIYTLFFARAVGSKGRVIAVEPNPQNYDELLSNIRLNHLDNVTAVSTAIGNSCGETTLAIDPVYPSRGFLATSRELSSSHSTQTIPVQVISLDSLVQDRHLPPPDFIKLDVEGVEIDAIHGMEETMHRYKPALFIEFHYEMTPLVQLLHAQGYNTYYIETATMITRENIPDVTWGHLFCT